jgi:polysaccharide biosynthesis/export protein
VPAASSQSNIKACDRRELLVMLRANFGLRLRAALGLLASPLLFWAMIANAQPPQPSELTPAGEYQIGPGDTLQVFVWRQPELSVTVPVRPDGRISTPLVEDAIAVGKTPTQLAREIESVLSEFVREPEVNIIVQNFVGTFGAQIRVLGEVVQPKSVAYRERMTLMDVITEVGGLTRFAAGKRARLVRSVNGESQEMRIRLDKLMKGDVELNIAMRPGDVVIVPQAAF